MVVESGVLVSNEVVMSPSQFNPDKCFAFKIRLICLLPVLLVCNSLLVSVVYFKLFQYVKGKLQRIKDGDVAMWKHGMSKAFELLRSVSLRIE